MKKKRQNRKRFLHGTKPDQKMPPAEAKPDEPDEPNERMVEHIRMVTSLIEGRRVSRDEIVEMLSKISRQHSIAHQSRKDYLVGELNKNPP